MEQNVDKNRLTRAMCAAAAVHDDDDDDEDDYDDSTETYLSILHNMAH